MSASNFFTGTPGKWDQRSTLLPDQQPAFSQFNRANQGQKGVGGTFGTLSDYYQNQLSDDSSDFNAFANPELRRFREQTVPDIAEQYAGFGSGALSSSGFRNSTINAGADLGERLAQIRAQIRQQSAQGLQNFGQLGLTQYAENTYTQGQPGFLQHALNAAGQIGGAYLGGPAGAAAGGALASKIGSFFNKGGEKDASSLVQNSGGQP